ncbi:MAG: hypothetical protein K2L95_00470 [Alphaproteobacteria bacterium]|nr:hypothetical protein [Alphaproteobacteria bacterium]
MNFKVMVGLPALMMVVMPVWGATFNMTRNDEMYALENPGAICSDQGHRVIICRCGADQNPAPHYVTDMCMPGMSFSGSGCYFSDTIDDNTKTFCVTANSASTASTCSLCNCLDTTENWVSIGSNRVSRYVKNAPDSNAVENQYTCQVRDYTEYGCAAGYYQSGGSGASMTCTRCPTESNLTGTNDVGDTKQTSCHIASGTRFSDTSGSGEYFGNSYWCN